MIVEYHFVAIETPYGKGQRRRIEVMGVDKANSTLPRKAGDCRIEFQHGRAVEYAVWNVNGNCFLKFRRVAIEDEQKRVGTRLAIQR